MTIRHNAAALWLGLLVAAAGALAVLADTSMGVDESLGLRWLFALRGPVAPPPQLLVVAIDEPSAQALGLPERPKGWPRRLHAEVVEHLARAGASVICFDLLFDTPSADPAEDQALAAAMARAGNVILTESVRVESVALHGGAAHLETVTRPIAEFERAARGLAAFLLPKASRVNTYWAFHNAQADAPSLPLLAYRLHSAKHGTSAAPLAPETEPYLNFYGPPRSIPTLPFAKVLQDARSGAPAGASSVAGKAVFIGYSAASPAGQDRLRDDYRTVFSQADGFDLSGVEIAATAFGNLLEGRQLQALSLPGRLALAALMGLALGLMCFSLRPPLALLAVLVFALVYLGLVYAAFVAQSQWLPSVVPLAAQAPLALAAGMALHYRRLQQERESIRRALGYYLPRSLVEDFARTGGPSTQSNRVLYGSCLASDIQGYTGIAETLAPAALGTLMNDYFAALFTPVEKSGGSVVDLVGDAMVAIWVKPNVARELRDRACHGALDAVAGLERFRRHDAGRRPALPTRFGLHAGDMLIGSIGGGGHFEYRAVGDIINTAARIQSLNKLLGTELLASAVSVEGLDDLALRPLGDFLLAGKANSVEVVEILGPKDRLSDAQRALLDGFAKALAAYRSRRWNEASTGLAELLQDWPEDGPCRFYRQRCDQLQAQPPGDDWDATIVVTDK